MSNLAIRLPKDGNYGVTELGRILRALAQDNARSKIEAENITSLTDSTGATASASYALSALALPPAYTVVGTTASPKAGFDTATGKLANCADSFAAYINPYLASLGLPKLVLGNGTVTSSLPSLDVNLTAVTGSGNSAVSAATGRAQLAIAKNNFSTVAKAVNDIAAALGVDPIIDASSGAAQGGVLADRAATAAGVDGTALSTLQDSAVDAFLLAIANNYATLAAYLNNVVLNPTDEVTLTDNTSGTASATLAALTLPSAFTVTGTDAAPKAGFDTVIGVIANNFSDVTSAINSIIAYNAYDEIDPLVDNSGGTANTTLAAMGDLTAVNGSGNNAVSQSTARTRLTNVRNNFATVVATLNLLSDKYGLEPITDSSGGTASASNTLAGVASATAAGVDGTSSSTLANADVNAFLAICRNSFASIAARINLLDNVGGTRPLQVVATL